METEILFEIFSIPINTTIFYSWIVIAIIALACFLLTRNLQRIPKGSQHLAEVIVESIDKLVINQLGESGRKYTPFIITMGLFVFSANLIGIFPGAVSPTQDLSLTLALAVIVFLVSHGNHIKEAGIKEYAKSYLSPFWVILPLNIVGEISKVASHSFRLYGNLFGGAIILNIVYMFFPYIIPVPLEIWFGVFMGAIQAFVFTLLAITYIQIRLE